ncbi:MAG: phosphoglycerate mutase family protein [Halobacteriovoraceae bacterium]|nr:phosphoglycerate mutase family protein [Halobacteriovoraceae bacterium]
MNSSEIAFIRHGAYHQPKNVPSALLPHPLTEEGIKQAKDGAKELLKLVKNVGLEVHPSLFSSTSLRAYQTATYIKEELEKAFNNEFHLKQSNRLCERSVGPMANLTVKEIETILEKDPRYEVPDTGWKSTPHFRLPYPGAESLYEAGDRVARFVREQVKDSNTKKLILFIGHGASFRFAAHHLGHWDIETARAHSMFNGRPVLLKLSKEKLIHNVGEWKKRLAKDEPRD